MQNIISSPVFHCLRQPQLRQYLAVPPINSSDCLKRRTIEQTHPGTRRVQHVRLYLITITMSGSVSGSMALPHLLLELIEIQSRRPRFTAPHRPSLAVHDLLFLLSTLTVNLVVDRLFVLGPVLGPQRDADLL